MFESQSRSRSGLSQELAKDRLGVPSVLFFVLAGVAPLTVAAGVIPTAYQTTGLTGIPAAFVAIAVILGLFAVGYVAMTRHITNSGAFYAFISRGIGRAVGVGAALIALLSYSFLQVGLYGAWLYYWFSLTVPSRYSRIARRCDIAMLASFKSEMIMEKR